MMRGFFLRDLRAFGVESSGWVAASAKLGCVVGICADVLPAHKKALGGTV